MDYTVLGILHARILDWVAFPFSRESSQPKDRTQVSSIAGGLFTSIRVFSNKSTLPIKGPKYQCFSFSISSFNDYSGLISFIIDWFYLLAVQGTHKSLLQHHNLKASVLQCSAFFMVQVSQNLPAMQETPFRLLAQEDHWRKERLHTPVFWPGEFQGLYSPWGLKELDMTEQL